MKRTVLALVPVFALATGCTFSGLPGDLVLGGMSDEEALQLCEATQRFNEENLTDEERKTYACNLAATIAGSVASGTGGDYTEACTEAQTTCEEDDADEGAEVDCEDVTYPDDCDATVEQYEACQRETVESIKTSNAEFTCEEPSDDESEDEDDDEKSACEIYREACGLTADPS